MAGDGTPLTRAAYEGLVAEDCAWLNDQAPSLEREHIRAILKRSAGHEYPVVGERVSLGVREAAEALLAAAEALLALAPFYARPTKTINAAADVLRAALDADREIAEAEMAVIEAALAYDYATSTDRDGHKERDALEEMCDALRAARERGKR